MRLIPAAVVLCAFAGLLSGCGTVVITDTFTVVADGPSHRLGDGAVKVSIFDSSMGFSRDWAARTMGTTAPGHPYTASVTSTDTKFVLDSSPPQHVSAGLALPQYTDDGYFQIRLDPADGQQQTSTAAFVPYAEHLPAGRSVPPVRLTVAAAAGEQGWDLHVTVHLPARPGTTG